MIIQNPLPFEAPPLPFRSPTALRDAVLAEPPFDRQYLAFLPPGRRLERQLMMRGFDTTRHGRGFIFGGFDVDGEGFHALSTAGTYAFAAGELGLPYEVFCGITALTLGGDTRLTMILAETIDNVVGDDGADLAQPYASSASCHCANPVAASASAGSPTR